MPSHVGANRIDKAYLGTTPVTAMYMGTERVYPNVTTWERYSLVWDFSGEASGTGQAEAANIIDVGTLEVVARAPAIGDVVLAGSASYYHAGVEVSFRHLQSLVSGKTYRHNSYYRTKTWLATKRAKGTLIDTIEHIDENAYPVDGISGEYWYVKM